VTLARLSAIRIGLLTTALIGQGCGNGTLSPADERVLPAGLRLVAEATGTDAGKDLSCSLGILARLDGAIERSTGRIVQFGTAGGDARRGWVVPAGNGVSFWAELAIADLEAHLIGADSVELRSPLGMAVTDSRFWRELGLLAGHTRNANPLTGELARGVWTCRPMDTPPSSGEYFDNAGTVTGRWTLRAHP
jgi:hypothetical protein